MTVWQYNANLDKALGMISLSPIAGAPLLGSVIPVPNGESPQIEILRPAGESWFFDDVVFSVSQNQANIITARQANPPPPQTKIYDYTQSPFIFDLKLLELTTEKIVLSNTNNVEANPQGAAIIGFRLVIEDSGLVYVSQDPQILDEPGG